MQQTCRTTPLPKCDSHENYNEITLQHEFSPVSFLIFTVYLFLRTPMGNCLCITNVNLRANICTNSTIKAMEKVLASVFLRLTLNKYSSTNQCISLFLIFYPADEKYFHWLKVHYCRLENLPIYFHSYEYNTLKISHSRSQEFLSYSPVMFAFFLKSRLIFNIFYCFFMFVNKHFENFTGI